MTYTIAQVRKHVSQLLDGAATYHPPIDVESIARQLQIEVHFEELDDEVSGLLLISGGRSTIAVNRDHHKNRQRFTIAHEIGHFILHRSDDDDLFVDKKVYHRNAAASQGMYRQEIEANRFAAEILMPKQLVESVISDKGGDIDLSDDFAVYQLARIFAVSEQALAIRLAALNFVPSL